MCVCEPRDNVCMGFAFRYPSLPIASPNFRSLAWLSSPRPVRASLERRPLPCRASVSQAAHIRPHHMHRTEAKGRQEVRWCVYKRKLWTRYHLDLSETLTPYDLVQPAV